MELKPYASSLGADVLGLDLATALSTDTLAAIQRAFLEYHVLFFRDQSLTPAEQIRFSAMLGELESYPYAHGLADHTEVTEIVKLPGEVLNFGSGWHVDMSFNPSSPDGAALYTIEIPPAGGDTLFCNLTLAYQTLSKGYRQMLDRLHGVHDSALTDEQPYVLEGMDMKPVRERFTCKHPLTRVHPDTGRKSLYISPDYCGLLDDLSREESAIVLGYLERHATQHEFICRFRWSPNTLVMWDNRCVMHRALDDDLGARFTGHGFKRVMHRTTFKRFFPVSADVAGDVARRSA